MTHYELKLKGLSFWMLYYKGKLVFKYPVSLVPGCLDPWERMQFVQRKYENLYYRAG